MKLRIPCPLPLIGDLNYEVWPPYLTNNQYVSMVLAAIAACDYLAVQQGLIDRIAYMLVGKARASRMVAVHLDDPRGIVYLLKDDGANDIASIEASAAITIGELTREAVMVAYFLELDKHRNTRLAYRSEPQPEPPLRMATWRPDRDVDA